MEPPAPVLPHDLVAGAIEHMNADHAGAVLAYARGLAGLEWASAARLLWIDESGIDLEATDGTRSETARVAFPQPLVGSAPDELRIALVNMAHAARAAGG